ncbi:MAG: hypothetical protein ACT4NL_07435 [Pseudomarimonas sp.]
MFKRVKEDRAALLQLKEELQHRNMPRAVTLLAQVQRSLRSPNTMLSVAPSSAALSAPTTAHIKIAAASPPQRDLWAGRAEVPESSDEQARTAGDSPMSPTARTNTETMAIADAYKLLKATPGANWESIELARRNLVQRSSPAKTQMKSAEVRAALLSEARLANEAYSVLAAGRHPIA